MAKREHKIYTEEFKQEAVKLALESEQSMAQTARDLGVTKTSLYEWVAKYASTTQKEDKKQNTSNEELVRLRRENKRLKQEREILKKAAAYFANQT